MTPEEFMSYLRLRHSVPKENPVIKLYAMEDVGTRLEHLADLQDLWSGGLAMLLSGTYHSALELEQVEKLEIALKLLENHMTHAYSDVKYAKDINELPRNPEDIPKENP
jgi:hypothetical protein